MFWENSTRWECLDSLNSCGFSTAKWNGLEWPSQEHTPGPVVRMMLLGFMMLFKIKAHGQDLCFLGRTGLGGAGKQDGKGTVLWI